VAWGGHRALKLVTAPGAEPLALSEVAPFLRVTGTDDDPVIFSLITAAWQHLDGRDGWLGRALVTQEWDLVLDEFPRGTGWVSSGAWNSSGVFGPCPIEVPLPPLQSVTHIKYIDNDGVEQTWAAAKYIVDTKSEPGRITPAFDESYPSTRRVMNAVTVRFVAGYGGPAAVPGPIKLAMSALVAHWFENREPVGIGVGAVAVEMPMHVVSLLAPFRVWRF
jgi:uncharacterized phiE125 gp8 family phage protein